jgi:hypothetical protein
VKLSISSLKKVSLLKLVLPEIKLVGRPGVLRVHDLRAGAGLQGPAVHRAQASRQPLESSLASQTIVWLLHFTFDSAGFTYLTFFSPLDLSCPLNFSWDAVFCLF